MGEPGEGAMATAAALLEHARRKTGLDDFGEMTFVEPLELFLQGCHTTARLNHTGAQVFPRVLVRHLANRLYLHDHLAGRPGAETTPPSVALVITGLPRTGTTVLHNLLALDPANRVLRLWEALHPVPSAEGPFSEAMLVEQARAWLARLYELAPSFRMVHGATAEGPEECDALLQNELASQHFEDMVHAEVYSRWLDHVSLRRQYASFARQLSVLDEGGDGRSWVLKSPSHLGHLDDLVHQFPAALIVHCHRRPVEAITSHASLVSIVRRPYSDHVRGDVVGEHVLRRGTVALERALSVRRAEGNDRFVDVGYETLRTEPLVVVARLYERLGRRLDDTTAMAMRWWLAEHPQHGHGVHRYLVADFGLDGGRIERSFARYLRRFADYLGG